MNPLFQTIASLNSVNTYAKYGRMNYSSAQAIHFVSEDKSAEQMAEQNAQQEYIEKKREEIIASQERAIRGEVGIKLTHRIFNSAEFLELLNKHAEASAKDIEKWIRDGVKINKEYRGAIAIYKSGRLNGNYLLAQGTISYFKKSKLPASERKYIDALFNLALDAYRQRRNEAARVNRKIRKYKKKLRDEGYDGEIVVHKVPFDTKVNGRMLGDGVAITEHHKKK